jgi:AcrR family transcriptional regulator
MFMRRVPEQTRQRILAAAAELFAEHGFHGTKARDIAARGKVNLAAGNYHYGSKKALYLEVLRGQFALIRSELERRGISRAAAELVRLPRGELVELLRKRVRIMLEMLLGPPPSLHGTLMQREMCDPSEALPVIVDEFIRPMMQEMQALLALLAPHLPVETVERCAFSTVGQVLFYRTAMPAMFYLNRWKSYPRNYAAQIADHITEVSLGGLERLEAQHPRRKAHA